MSAAKRRMRAGEIYRGDDEELGVELDARQALVHRHNAIPYEQEERRRRALAQLLGSVGAGAKIHPPFYCDFGDGISLGARTFVNSTCTMLDGASITIGEECLLASGVQLVTATHPLDPAARRDGWEMARPITLADGVWLGAGVIVCPGVSIGENTVVGAGAVVTRDLPAGVVAYGNPARVRRELGEADSLELPAG